MRQEGLTAFDRLRKTHDKTILSTYDMYCTRNRLHVEGIGIPHNNASEISTTSGFGSSHRGALGQHRNSNYHSNRPPHERELGKEESSSAPENTFSIFLTVFSHFTAPSRTSPSSRGISESLLNGDFATCISLHSQQMFNQPFGLFLFFFHYRLYSSLKLHTTSNTHQDLITIRLLY